jgi:hypothetical protein
MRAFADAWAGSGTGTAAARAAGYQGTDATVQVRASQLLRHPGVRARIEARLGAAALAAPEVPLPSVEAPGPALVKGRGRGTATERVELLMAMARDKKAPVRERVQAIGLAAELEGERKPARARGAGRQPMIPLPTAPAAPSSPPKLTLVLNPKDAGG